MALRTINYTVTADDISPKTEQNAGIQGESNVTKLVFTLSEELYNAIEAQEGDTVYRIQASDGAGGFYSTSLLTLNALNRTVTYSLDTDLSGIGGVVYLHLIISKIINDSEDTTLYSFPARIRFANAAGSYSEAPYRQAISGALKDVLDAKSQVMAQASYVKSSISTVSAAEESCCNSASIAYEKAEAASAAAESAASAAVTEAISEYDNNNTFRHISSITLSEATQCVVVNEDDSQNDINLKKIRMRIFCPKGEVSYIQIRVADSKVETVGRALAVGIIDKMSDTSDKYNFVSLENTGYTFDVSFSQSTNKASPTQMYNIYDCFHNSYPSDSGFNIKTLLLCGTGNTVLPAGTTIEIWGY